MDIHLFRKVKLICSAHGGLAIYLSSQYKFKSINMYENSDIWEGQFMKLQKKSVIIGNIYRPLQIQMPYAKHLLTSLYQYLNTYKEITAKAQSLVILTLIYLKLMIMLYFVTILTQFCPRVSSHKCHCQPDSQIGAVP